MLTISTLQTVLANTFFDGALDFAGLAMFAVILAVIMAITKSTFKALVIVLPVTILFSGIGVLSMDLTIILVIIIVLGLALTASKVGFGK